MLFRRHLVARHFEHARGRADEGDAGVSSGLREVGVLREEAVAGVNGVSATLLGYPNDFLDIEVSTNGVTLFANLIRLIGFQAMHGVAVFVGENRDGARPNLDCRTKRPNSDLAPVCYKNLFKQCIALRHGQYIGRWGGRESTYFIKDGAQL